MLKLILSRVIQTILVVFILVTFVFFAVRAIPVKKRIRPKNKPPSKPTTVSINLFPFNMRTTGKTS
jgi:ABC-type dipeptide/oligopeptide/nickel transport system permease component